MRDHFRESVMIVSKEAPIYREIGHTFGGLQADRLASYRILIFDYSI